MAFPRLRRWARPVTPLSRAAHRGRWRCSLPVLQPIRGDPAAGAARGDGVGHGRSAAAPAAACSRRRARLARRTSRLHGRAVAGPLGRRPARLGDSARFRTRWRRLESCSATTPFSLRRRATGSRSPREGGHEPLRAAADGGARRRGGKRGGSCARRLHCGAGPRSAELGGGLRAARGSQARETARDGARGAHRRRARARPPLGPRRRAGAARRAAPAARAATGPAHARALPLRPAGRGAGGLPRRTGSARRGAGVGAVGGAARARAQDAAPGSRAGGAGRDRGRRRPRSRLPSACS